MKVNTKQLQYIDLIRLGLQDLQDLGRRVSYFSSPDDLKRAGKRCFPNARHVEYIGDKSVIVGVLKHTFVCEVDDCCKTNVCSSKTHWRE